jgi:uncharacterized protein
MNFSRHNIFSRISGSENWFIVNPLTGNADILSPAEGQMLRNYLDGKDGHPGFIEELTTKGYILSEQDEKQLYRSKYLDFTDARDQDEVQIFFVPNYNCNFACTYCYQDEYDYPHQALGMEVIDSFFQYVAVEFAGRKKYITVFGGEPLLNSPRQRELIGYFLDKASAAGLDICLVTNGFWLVEYQDILKRARIREV